MSQAAKKIIEQLLSYTDIKLNGPHTWDPQIKDDRFYARVLHHHELGIGETYMDGFWECAHIDELVYHLYLAHIDRKVPLSKTLILHLIINKLFNLQSRARAFIVGQKHYDISNKLYRLMLDDELNYSCAYWKDATTLDQAQFNKLDLICRKLQLKPGMRLLDIGCGWGSMARHAAKYYGVEVVGVTISKEQKALAEQLNGSLPITIHLADYRTLNDSFDRIVSIGMFEHVGIKNYPEYFRVAHRCLKEDGLFLLHTIADHHSRGISNPWITKYIFPNGALPALHHVARSIDRLFVMEDWHSFGADYDKTLMAWHQRFNAAWPQIQSDICNERFKRMWNFYLLSCAGAFRARNLQLWQIVLSKTGIVTGYHSIR